METYYCLKALLDTLNIKDFIESWRIDGDVTGAVYVCIKLSYGLNTLSGGINSTAFNQENSSDEYPPAPPPTPEPNDSHSLVDTSTLNNWHSDVDHQLRRSY